MNTIRITLQGNFAHYKRLGGANVKQTHTIPTQTSIFGLIGAVLGRPRDSYYEEFGDKFEISIVPKNIRRYSIPQLELSTASISSIGKTWIRTPRHRKNRQRISLEYLVDPEFDVYIRAESIPPELIERLEQGEYEYTPYLGTTECLATINYHGGTELERSEETEIDSVVPESDVERVLSTENSKLTFERMASNFTQHKSGRSADGYLTAAVNLNSAPIHIEPSDDTTIYRDPRTNQTLIFL